MPSNYEILKNSENQSFSMFSNYVQHVIKTWKELLQTIENKTYKEKTVYDRFVKLENRSNNYEAEILDECIWIISKNQPVANHLRFIIAILNSIIDLERMADYAMSMIKYFYTSEDKLSEKVESLTVTILKESIQAIEKILNNVLSKYAMESYKEGVKIQTQFNKKYKEHLIELSKILSNQTAKQIGNMMTGNIINIKYMERSVDHAINITENFLFIKNSDFFLSNKKAKIKTTSTKKSK